MQIPELLVPAKNIEYLKCVVNCGANSVYMGYSKYNARMFGTNFSEEDFRSGILYAHEHGAKVYLTMNTLIKESELQDATALAMQAVKDGVDGIIVQDLGLAKSIKERVPYVHLHASTQMSVANHFGTSELVNMGFLRVVLARELSTDEILQIKKFEQKNHHRPLEIEVFIQGGLCIAYSGQCLASSFFLGSSSNNGKCMMPCWDKYTLYENATILDNGILIRPKDLCGITEIKRLIDGRIDSFKIQGRLRNKPYITEVTNIYRSLLDEYSENLVSEQRIGEDYKCLQSVSPRGLTGGNLVEAVSDQLIICNDSKSETISDVTTEQQPQNQLEQFIESGRMPLMTGYKVTVVLHKLTTSFSYQMLTPTISRIYIPYRELVLPHNAEVITQIAGLFDVYIYMPPMITERNCEHVYSSIYPLLQKYKLNGVVLSNISDFCLLDDISAGRYTFISGNHLHVTNHATCELLKTYGISCATLSLELSSKDACDVAQNAQFPLEQMIYGHPDLMHMKYCILKKRTNCGACTYCNTVGVNNRYSLSGQRCSFEAVMYSAQTESILFAAKPMNIPKAKWFGTSLRMDFLYETPEEINGIIASVLESK